MLVMVFPISILFLNIIISPVNAIWGEEDGNIAYYKMDETSGNIIDVFGMNNGTNNNGVLGSVGIINYSVGFNGVNSLIDFGDPDSRFDFLTGNFTESYWIYPNSTNGDYVGHIFLNSVAAGNRFQTAFYGGNLTVYIGSWKDTGITLNNYTWSFVTWTRRSGVLKLYINGSDTGWNVSHTGNIQVNYMKFGYHNSYLNGSLDEIGFWNRSLTDSEINFLYNDGNGTAYGVESIVNVTLNSPADFSTNRNPINFNCSGKTIDDTNLINISLYHNVSGIFEINRTINVSGIENTTNFTMNLPFGNYKWNCYICNENNKCSFSDKNFTLTVSPIKEKSQDYNQYVQETSNQTFSINLTYDSSIYVGITANLSYNGTSYSGEKIGSGDNIVFNISIIIPEVSNSTEVPFHWEFELNDGSSITYANSTFHNQTILPITVINITTSLCGSGYFEAANFSFKDSENLTSLTNMTIKYNFNYGVGGNDSEEIYGEFNNTGSFRICINETISTYEIGYGEIDYQKEGYVERRYYMFDGHSLSNSTTEEFTLYDLPNGDSTSFIFEIKNTFLNPYTDKYISLLRWYPDLNEYKTVEMALTDEDGKTVMKVHTEDIDYRVGVYNKDGSLIKLANPVRMACLINPCTYTLKIVSDDEDYTEIFDIETSLTWDSDNNRFVFTWNDPSQNTIQMRLLVTKDLGFQESVICNETSSGNTGVLICSIGNSTGKYKAVGFRTASPEIPLISKFKEIRDRMNNIWGLFISFMLMLIMALIGIFSPIGAIVMMVIGAIPAYILGSIGWVVLMGIGILGGLIIHIIKRA